MDRSFRQKPNRDLLELIEFINQMDIIDIYRTFHPTTKEYTFYSELHRTLSKFDHILGHKASLNRYKKIEITPCILSDHHRLKLDINNRNNRKLTNSWKQNNSLLNKNG